MLPSLPFACREVLPVEASADLAKLWNSHVQQQQQQDVPDDPQICSRVARVVSQAYTYMCTRGLTYAAITTYDHVWLLCCEQDGILQVSRGFGREDTSPTPREVHGGT